MENEIVEVVEPETRVARVKRHFRENKKGYIIGSVGFIVGAATAVLLVKRSSNNALMVQQGVMYKPIQTVDVHVEALGDPGNIIQDITTGSIYASQGQAARELGLDAAAISKHLNGLTPHVRGHIFEILGKAHVSEAA